MIYLQNLRTSDEYPGKFLLLHYSLPLLPLPPLPLLHYPLPLMYYYFSAVSNCEAALVQVFYFTLVHKLVHNLTSTVLYHGDKIGS